MNWTVLVAYCIIDDLLKTLGHRDDPQSKTPASVILTLWVLAALAFAEKHKHALAYAQEQALFSFIPSRSRFSRRLHSLAPWIPLLLPLGKALWEQLSAVEYYILPSLRTPRSARRKYATTPYPCGSGKTFGLPVPAWRPPANTAATFRANAATSMG